MNDPRAPQRLVPWPFNWRQYPRWMNGYSQEDHPATLEEMRDVIAGARDPYIPSIAAWRERVLGAWQEIGGKREDMLALFRETDASAQKNIVGSSS